MKKSFQVINTGPQGIAKFDVFGVLKAVSNAGAAALGGANESPLYSSLSSSGVVGCQFAYYDDCGGRHDRFRPIRRAGISIKSGKMDRTGYCSDAGQATCPLGGYDLERSASVQATLIYRNAEGT